MSFYVVISDWAYLATLLGILKYEAIYCQL